MTSKSFKQIKPILEEKLQQAIYNVTSSMTLDELKKIDWLCAKSDYYISMEVKTAA